MPRARSLATAAALGMFVLAWAVTTPPAGFPDEVEHYVRALAVGRGEVRGERNPALDDPTVTVDVPKSCCAPGNETSVQWVHKGIRIVDIPATLAPERLECTGARHRPSSPCETGPGDGTIRRHTTMGTIEPVPYLLPGLLTRLTTDPDKAILLARLANAGLLAGFLALAALALRSRRSPSPLALTGLVTATSPGVLFVGASPSPSAVEVGAGLAFFALLLRVVRAEDEPPATRTWIALAVVGAALATSRSLGPVWIAADVAVIVALTGFRRVWELVRDAGRTSAVAMGAVAVAGASTVVWEIGFQPKVAFDLGFFVNQIGPSLGDLTEVGKHLVGKFASLDLSMPMLAYWTWAGVVLALVGTALAVGSRRDRVVLVGLVVLNVVVAVLVSAAIIRQNGFGLQGRHILAFTVSVPLVANEILLRRRDALHRLVERLLPVAVVVVAGAVHVTAIVVAGRRYGWLDDDGLVNPWMPPGGPTLWVVIVVIAAAALVGTTLTAVLPLRPDGDLTSRDRSPRG